MKRHFCILIVLGFMLNVAGTAAAQPVPTAIKLPVGDSVPGFIRGTYFGPESGAGQRPGPVVSTQELRSCLVLADTLTLVPGGWAHVVRSFYWRDDMVAFSLRGVPQAVKDCLYFFVIDDKGAVSLPIGPVGVVEGSPVLDEGEALLAAIDRELWDRSPVKLLIPQGQGAEPDCLEFDQERLAESPGICGQPVLAN